MDSVGSLDVEYDRTVRAFQRPVPNSSVSIYALKVGKTHVESRASFTRDSLAMTCPQGSNIGGLFAVLCSFETGQAKIE